MLYTKFRSLSTGSGEDDFKGFFLPYMGMIAILVMLQVSCLKVFISMYLKTCIQNLVKNGTVVAEKSKF